VQDFSRLVNPRAVAVVGASNDLSRIGGQPLKLLTEFGFQGKVYPVNPKYPEIKGLTCYKDIASLPKTVRRRARRAVVESCAENHRAMRRGRHSIRYRAVRGIQ